MPSRASLAYPGSLTATTWTVSGARKHRKAPVAGTCLLTGVPFAQGAEVSEATVNGVDGFISLSGSRALDVVEASSGELCSRFALVKPSLDIGALMEQATSLVLCYPGGGGEQFTRDGAVWSRNNLPVPTKRLLGRIAKALALAAYV